MYSAYPKTDYDDPKAALASFVHVLSAYPLRIVDQLTNLETGLQVKYKFPPRLAEIKQEAEAIVAAEKAAAERVNAHRAREERRRQQLEEETRFEAERGARPSYAELKARYGPTFGIDPDAGERKAVESSFKAPTWPELQDYYRANPDRISKLTGSATNECPQRSPEPSTRPQDR